jgi:hypothetical protein
MKKSHLIGLGSELIALIVVAVWVGRYLDEAWSRKGLGVAVAVSSAFVIWIAHLVVLLKAPKR